MPFLAGIDAVILVLAQPLMEADSRVLTAKALRPISFWIFYQILENVREPCADRFSQLSMAGFPFLLLLFPFLMLTFPILNAMLVAGHRPLRSGFEQYEPMRCFEPAQSVTPPF